MNILGLDYGQRRIGVSIARGGVKIAHPLVILANDDSLEAELESLITEENISMLVIGLPRNLRSEDTEQTKLTRIFIDRVRSLWPELQVIERDEAGTSQQARTQAPDRRHVDDIAAAIILQDYLEA